jgi:hypothetical protein
VKSPKNSRPDDLYPALPRRVAELERALQNAYLWAYTSGRLSEIDGLMEEAAVPIPAGIATRTRMIRVWETGLEKFCGWSYSPKASDPGRALSWMLNYSARMCDSPARPRGATLECLWKTAKAASNLLPAGTDFLALALEEYLRASKKHPGMTLECDGLTDDTRLFALVEEIGEVAACLTYDNDAETGHGSDLESEVIQVIALALAWATRYLDD